MADVMADVNLQPAESSPVATIPSDPKEYAEWRQTGKLPEPKAESAPAQESSDEGAPERDDAPGSDPEKKQEPKEPKAKPSKAEARLNEILEDLRRAGLSPAELKTFRKEHTEKPKGLEPPKKPQLEDFESYDAYEEAKDKYYEELAEYKAAKKLEELEQKRRQEATRLELAEKLKEARGRYGDAVDTTIASAAEAIFFDQQIPPAVKAIIDDSPVVVDLLYTIGSNAEELAEFVSLAESRPAAAIRKAVLLERLVSEELGKGKKAGEAGRKAPEKETTKAPPPPREVSGRGSVPPDEVEAAAKAGDFRAYKEAANRRDLARMRGQ